jgi:hypothetical protein
VSCSSISTQEKGQSERNNYLTYTTKRREIVLGAGLPRQEGGHKRALAFSRSPLVWESKEEHGSSFGRDQGGATNEILHLWGIRKIILTILADRFPDLNVLFILLNRTGQKQRQTCLVGEEKSQRVGGRSRRC